MAFSSNTRPVVLPASLAQWTRLPLSDEAGSWTFKHIDSGTTFEFDGQFGEALAALDMDFFEQDLPEGVYELDFGPLGDAIASGKVQVVG